MDFALDAVLAPWSSRFVASAERRSQYNSATGACDLSVEPVVELSRAAHETYAEIYQHWHDETDRPSHGLFGYDRPMECAQSPGEIMLLRLDADGTTGHDFIEACTLYFLITPIALEHADFSAVRAVYGPSI